MNILFLGNSLIFYNDMPAIFRDLATAGGQEVTVESVTKGSATMSHFAFSVRAASVSAASTVSSKGVMRRDGSMMTTSQGREASISRARMPSGSVSQAK